MMNARSILLISVLAASSTANAQVPSVAVGPRPESITKAWNNKFYVSIQGPSGNLGVFDGEVREVNLTTGVVTPFVVNLENPRGLAFTGGFLVVADQQKIFKISQSGQVTLLAQASQFPFPAVFFNDASPATSNSVYVTEMGRRDIIREPAGSPNAGRLIPIDTDDAYAVPATSRVYKITLSGQISNVFAPSRKLLVINGVSLPADGGGLLAVDFFHGNIVRVRVAEDKKEIIATAIRGADGIAQASNGTLFVSSFENGAVWRMDANGENQTRLISGQGFQTTADFYLDEPAQKLYVPQTAAGTVLIVSTQ
jgi:sugar lactone lactonase YvrE